MHVLCSGIVDGLVDPCNFCRRKLRLRLHIGDRCNWLCNCFRKGLVSL